jgi:hypothetical protein
MAITVRNLSTNESMTLEPDHRVWVVPLASKEWGDYPVGEQDRHTDTTEAVTALSWATEWPDRHAYVRTERVAEAKYGDDGRERRVWVRCSLKLL